MSNTRSVERHFSKAARTYNSHALIQRSAAELLSWRIRDACNEASIILDVGCGTGFLSKELSRLYPSARIIGLDISPGMLACAQEELAEVKNVSFILGDAREFLSHEKFDLIVSSSSLQWLNPLRIFCTKVKLLLKPGGFFCISSMLEGTLNELHSLRMELFPQKPPGDTLPSQAELQASMKAAGLSILVEETHEAKQYFDSAEDFIQAIRTQGFTGGSLSSSGLPLSRREIRQLELEYETRWLSASGRVPATYRFGIAIARLTP